MNCYNKLCKLWIAKNPNCISYENPSKDRCEIFISEKVDKEFQKYCEYKEIEFDKEYEIGCKPGGYLTYPVYSAEFKGCPYCLKPIKIIQEKKLKDSCNGECGKRMRYPISCNSKNCKYLKIEG